jgi:hypothetical protein
MADFELLVLSSPPDGVSEDAYNDWYDTHVQEVLALPGFVAAERQQIELIGATSPPTVPFAFLTRYEIVGPFEDAWAELRAAVDGGRLTMYDWFPGVLSQGWRCNPLRERVVSDI